VCPNFPRRVIWRDTLGGQQGAQIGGIDPDSSNVDMPIDNSDESACATFIRPCENPFIFHAIKLYLLC